MPKTIAETPWKVQRRNEIQPCYLESGSLMFDFGHPTSAIGDRSTYAFVSTATDGPMVVVAWMDWMNVPLTLAGLLDLMLAMTA